MSTTAASAPHPRDEGARLLSALTASRPDDERLTSALADIIGEQIPIEVYLFILSNGGASPDDLQTLGHADETLEAALAVLRGRGMIHTEASGWQVRPPEQALPALASQFESRATNIRSAIPGLVAAYRNAARTHGGSTGIQGTQVLTGEHEVALAFAQCFSGARAAAKAMRVHSMATREPTFDALPGSRQGHLAPRGNDVVVHTVIDTALIAAADRDALADFQHAPNVHVRLATGVPFTAAVNDSGIAVIETYLDGRIDGVLLRDPGLVAAIEATIDLMVRVSSPLRLARPGTNRRDNRDASHPPAMSVLDLDDITHEERTILSLQAAGVPDTTVARRLGISTRTLDRRIRSLMDRLGATTRFQAGVLAERRGWL